MSAPRKLTLCSTVLPSAPTVLFAFGHRSFLWVPECPHKGTGKLEGFLKLRNQFLSKLSIPSLKKEVNKSGVVLTYFQSSKLPKRYFIP